MGDRRMRPTLGILLLTFVTSAASALDVTPLPEPGSLELLAIGAVAAVAVAIRKRRK
jgi:hypothetical protein